ncbi:unnamed protein product, partial [Polarella glacialis]
AHVYDEAFLAGVSREARLQLSEFDSRHVSNLVWSFATVLRRDAPLFSQIEAVCSARAVSFGPQELANTAWAFAAVGHDAPQLMESLFAE